MISRVQDLNLAASQRHLLKQCEHLEIEGRGVAIAPFVKDLCQQPCSEWFLNMEELIWKRQISRRLPS